MNASSPKQAVDIVETIGFQHIPWRDIFITLGAAVSAGFSGALVLGLMVFLLSAEARADAAAQRVSEARSGQNPQVGRSVILLRRHPEGGATVDAPLLSTEVEMYVSGKPFSV